jgi:hypothetical protein
VNTVAKIPINREMQTCAQKRPSELWALSFEELSSLPESETRQIDILGERVQLTVYRASELPDQTLVVVQAVRERWFGIMHSVHAVGFIVSPSGQKRDAPEEKLWDYT